MRFQPVVPVAVLVILLVVLFLFLLIGALRNHGTVLHKTVTIIVSALLCLSVVPIAVRPMIRNKDIQYARPNLDVLFVLDTTMSMWAEDYQNDSRMDGAIETMEFIMEEMNGSSFALITFGDKSEIKMPITQDAQSIDDAIKAIRIPDRWLAGGTSLNSPFENMEYMLSHMGKEEGHERIVFFLSDGEITVDEEMTDFTDMASMIDGGAVLGFGTPKGATITDRDGHTLFDYDTCSDAVTCLDMDSLNDLADALEIDCIQMKNRKDVSEVIEKAVVNAEEVMANRDDLDNYDDIYYMFVPGFMILLLAAFLLYKE
ncbi:MAG: VWA domain-containing protein [Lachnospiraceae bacterium]|nr:VWA domain-containing protein [Lachnospiraceae bacterium]